MRRQAALCLALACGTGAVTIVDPASPSGSLDIGDISSVPDATLRETVGGGNNLGAAGSRQDSSCLVLLPLLPVMPAEYFMRAALRMLKL